PPPSRFHAGQPRTAIRAAVPGVAPRPQRFPHCALLLWHGVSAPGSSRSLRPAPPSRHGVPSLTGAREVARATEFLKPPPPWLHNSRPPALVLPRTVLAPHA